MKLDADYEELNSEGRPVKPEIKALAFLGIIVLAVIFAVVLWSAIHRDRGEGNPAPEQTGEAMLDEADGISREDVENSSGGSGEPKSGASSSGSGEPESGASSSGSGEPESGMSSGGSGEPESGASSSGSGEPESGMSSGGSGEPESGASSSGSGEPDPGPLSGGSGESESGDASGSASEGETEASAAEETDNGASEQGAANELMTFAECQDSVTPKEVINLRSAPSTLEADNIVTQAVNGEVLARTGVNEDTGWSRIEYNGRTLYAVSRYLTEDLNYQPPVAVPDANRVSTKDGRTIIFTDCDDRVSPKIHVNLRLEPSTSEGNATVHCALDYGVVIRRTGISEDSGWSRVEYDGNVLYVVSSYVYVVEDTAE
ncbi:MAG: SH3 domain-containing protein [Ruminococcus flavefaciens]|nr:SH3 domain-containing protein [Ruminococcus flavefaciens]